MDYRAKKEKENGTINNSADCYTWETAGLDLEKKKQDSLNAATPKYIFTVEEVSGIKKQFKAYLRKGNGLISESGKPFEYDPDKMYGVFENGEFTLIQYHVFDPLLKEYNDFIQK